jgi:competence protein ComEA
MNDLMKLQLRRLLAVAALVLTLAGGGAAWLSPRVAAAAPSGGAARAAAEEPADLERPRSGKPPVTGKLNLNTATVDELMMLPGIGLSKAERIIAWRTKHGPFKRPADLRRVKGFGYKTFKKLEPHLDVKGDSTLRPKS